MGEDKITKFNITKGIVESIREVNMYKNNVLDANVKKTWGERGLEFIGADYGFHGYSLENIDEDTNFTFDEDSNTFSYKDKKLYEHSCLHRREEYTKFLDYKGKNLFVSRTLISVGKLKGYATLAYERGIEGKVVEIDRGEMFIIGDYVSKVKGET